jgi:prepilin-type N-terminal cleavage/methylation domain-containing protein
MVTGVACIDPVINMRSFGNKIGLKGFSLVEVMIVVAIIGLLTAISLPNMVKSRMSATRNSCVSNLRQIEAAKRIWALEKQKISSDVPVDSDLFGSTAFVRDKPACPAGGSYGLNAVGVQATCSLNISQGHSL